MITQHYIIVSSIIIFGFCIIGVIIPKVVDDEDIRIGINAILVSFILGYLTNFIISIIIV